MGRYLRIPVPLFSLSATVARFFPFRVPANREALGTANRASFATTSRLVVPVLRLRWTCGQDEGAYNCIKIEKEKKEHARRALRRAG